MSLNAHTEQRMKVVLGDPESYIDVIAQFDLVPTGGQKLALAGTVGTPGPTNKYVTNSDLRVSGNRSQFFPCLDASANLGDYRVQNVGTSAAARFDFVVPPDFGTLVQAALIGAPSAGASGPNKDIDFASDYGKDGESITQHSETNTTSKYNLAGTSGEWYALDISSVFSALAKGDRCGVTVTHNAIGGSGIDYIGIELIYTPAAT